VTVMQVSVNGLAADARQLPVIPSNPNLFADVHRIGQTAWVDLGRSRLPCIDWLSICPCGEHLNPRRFRNSRRRATSWIIQNGERHPWSHTQSRRVPTHADGRLASSRAATPTHCQRGRSNGCARCLGCSV